MSTTARSRMRRDFVILSADMSPATALDALSEQAFGILVDDLSPIYSLFDAARLEALAQAAPLHSVRKSLQPVVGADVSLEELVRSGLHQLLDDDTPGVIVVDEHGPVGVIDSATLDSYFSDEYRVVSRDMGVANVAPSGNDLYARPSLQPPRIPVRCLECNDVNYIYFYNPDHPSQYCANSTHGRHRLRYS